ncbi:cell division protein FtsQ/DivIB [Bacteriovoracaceae bacterium]|nr:cell division protein FtsQ/DivIB [Bacteriovoracaceae bacterium]
MKVQIYKENGLDSYEAILVDNGELFDPTYEVLLRTEKKLKGQLPYFALPVGEIDKNIQKEVSHIVKKMSKNFRKKISEVILNDNKDLTIILSINGGPSSVFIGKEDWDEKVEKLKKIVSYMESKKKMPAIINLTNSKKVVVKFND